MIETPKRVLVVIPHPDDAEGWCGGTVARWIREGAEVFYVLCTDGGKGSDDPQMTSARLVPIREREQLAAADSLGVREVVTLRHPDGELEDTVDFRKELVRAVRRFQPDVLLCPDPYRRASNWHRDHRVTGQVASDAAFPYARDHLHFPELLKEEGLDTHKTGTLLFWAPDIPDTYLDITDTIDAKISALVCHESQMSGRGSDGAAQWVRDRAKEAGKDQGFEYAEGFRKLEFRR